MAVTVYKEKNFQGIFSRLNAGTYSGRQLQGCGNGGGGCEDLDNAISSLRVDPNTIVAYSDGHSLRAPAARVVVGPAEIADLGVMAGKISALRVTHFRPYDGIAPPPSGGVTLYDSHSGTGRRVQLGRGDYSPARLAAEELRMPGDRVVSVGVEAGHTAILYAGDAFEADSDAVLLEGPVRIDDLDSVGMLGRVRSVRVILNGNPDRPASAVPMPVLAPVASRPAPTPIAGLLGWLDSMAPAAPAPAAPAPAQPKGESWIKTVLAILFFIVAVIMAAILGMGGGGGSAPIPTAAVTTASALTSIN